MWQRFTGTFPTAESNFITDGGDSFSAVQISELCQDPKLVQVLLFKTFSEVKTGIKCKNLKIPHPTAAEVIEPKSKKGAFFPLLWKANLGKCIDASPISSSKNSLIIIGSHSGILAAFDIEGSQKWKIQLGDRIEATICSWNGVCFVGTYGGNFFCIDEENGEVLWQDSTSRDIIKNGAIVLGQNVIFGSHDGHVKALDVKNGTVKWTTDLKSSSILAPMPAEELAICATLKGQVAILWGESGALKSSFMLDSPIFSRPLVWRGQIVVASVKGVIYCLNFEDILWTFNAYSHVFSPLTNLGNLCFFGSQEGKMSAVDLEQRILVWSLRMENNIHAGICQMSPREILILDSRSNFRIVNFLDSACISLEGSFEIGQTFSTPLKIGHHLLVGSRDDHLYCFNC